MMRLAVLSGQLDGPRAARLIDTMLAADGLVQTTIYFSHYLFEALAAVGAGQAMSDALEMWRGLPAQGFVTPPESPEPSRSDCHGWGSHPLYHLVASVMGVRPGAFGFGSVAIRPNLGPLRSISGVVPHPRGAFPVAFEVDGEQITTTIALPDGVAGELIASGETFPLHPGENVVRFRSSPAQS